MDSSDAEDNAREVDISMAELRNFDPSALSLSYNFRPEIVQKLTLYGNDLNILPASIVQFIHLRHLDISANRISWISGEVARLPLLKILDARNNRLNNLPKEIEQCPKLLTLNLSGNQFKVIPTQVFTLSRLKELYLGGNQIESLPPQIQSLESLEMLYLGGNKIFQVPPHLGKLTNLRHLVLCDNKISTIPQELGQLKKLESLSLHKNELKLLPMAIVMLLNLQELTLRDNPLVHTFIKRLEFNTPSLLELAGRVVKTQNIPYNNRVLPKRLCSYLDSAKRCVNPKCDGVYFDSRIKCVKFVDFCGKFRLPLEQYLCSPCDTHEECCGDSKSVSAQMLRKALLPDNV